MFFSLLLEINVFLIKKHFPPIQKTNHNRNEMRFYNNLLFLFDIFINCITFKITNINKLRSKLSLKNHLNLCMRNAHEVENKITHVADAMFQ